jgi:uracil-DNA glycosylase
MKKPWKLRWYDSGECQVVHERLSDLTRQRVRFCPDRKDLYKALELINPEDVKVCILGQDPYPGKKFATGVAFSIPEDVEDIPPTLQIIFDEYEDDLKYPTPTTGSLLSWVNQGVLLWNVIPSCEAGKPMSHHWCEYEFLNKEILETLRDQSVVFVALGNVAKEVLLRYVSYDDAPIVTVGHPSPRGLKFSKTPFKGSRLFTTINTKLVEHGLKPIDWRLP